MKKAPGCCRGWSGTTVSMMSRSLAALRGFRRLIRESRNFFGADVDAVAQSRILIRQQFEDNRHEEDPAKIGTYCSLRMCMFGFSFLWTDVDCLRTWLWKTICWSQLTTPLVSPTRTLCKRSSMNEETTVSHLRDRHITTKPV